MDLIVAHMMGDYLLQNTWMAMNKARRVEPCLLHSFLYTLAVSVVCGWWDWRALVVGASHYVIDHYRIGVWWRQLYSRDTDLPWVITADNTMHLLILFLLAKV